ncbi:MAG: PGRS repeat-containing protein, partial [Mycobacterium sp.]|uniref:PGRS repeat-containing protein n=1 Tax=Mycobacterium sp. TaxID=1785 RepID=UPI003C5E8528
MARHRSIEVVVATAGAFFAFGMSPLVTAPAAHADEFELILEPILNSLSSIDPGLATEVSTLATSFDPTFAAESAAAAATAAATPDSAELFNQFVYAPTHAAIESWINSSVGEQVDGFINSAAGTFLIGDGAPGTMADPDGGAAGLLFGDGGTGWDSTEAGVAGGHGGDAG